jgi:activating signal cointegrator complex subunit 3
MQIFGRAGRPQFDTSGHGVIITSHDKLAHYLKLLHAQLPVESALQARMADHLNAEICLGTVSSLQEGAVWLGYTYLYIRAARNPLAYGISPEARERDPDLFGWRLGLLRACARRLDAVRMVRFNPATGALDPTELGRIAASFYLGLGTIELFNDAAPEDKSERRLTPLATDAELLGALARSQDFENIKARDEEQDELAELLASAPLKVKGGLDGPGGKVNVLLQAYISGAQLKASALVSDLNFIAQSAGRVARGFFEIALSKGWIGLALKALTLSKMLEWRLWATSSPLRQVGGLPEEAYRRLEAKRTPRETLLDMSDAEAGALVSHPKLGAAVRAAARRLPAMLVELVAKPITRTVLRVELTLTADFDWAERAHGAVQPWYVWVEDFEDEHVYHKERLVLHRSKAREPQTLSFTIPLFEPLPAQYLVRVVSETFLGSETVVSLPLGGLALPSAGPAHTPLLALRPLPRAALGDAAFERLFKFEHFNPVQSQLFHATYQTDANVLVGAPTGSGKTVTAELAVLRLLRAHPGKKAIYIAPLKALVRERMADWRRKLVDTLGLKLVELTGDVSPDMHALRTADVLCTTPEKWDSVSRGWQSRGYVRDVGLVIIDEVHLLGEERGPVLEVIVSRMRFIASQGGAGGCRFVAMTSSLANAHDLADWLGVGEDGLFNFKPSVRPVPLEVHISGHAGKHYCPRMAAMNRPCYRAIIQHAPDKPTLVFVSSRRQTRLTALDLISYCSADERADQFVNMGHAELALALERVRDPALRHTLAFGVGIHHAGLGESDRTLCEELFVSGQILVLVSTSTLAWGVNFPAHLVVVKGTEFYDGKEKRYVDFPITDVLQMMGRAGRPQYDDHGVAVILVHEPKKNFYRKFLYEPFPVESCLHEQLHDHFNAEIAGGTITSKQDAVDYLTWTFFYRRLRNNPSYYHLADAEPSSLSAFLSELVEGTVAELEAAGCVLVEPDGLGLAPTPMGHVASFYYLKHSTVARFRAELGADDDGGAPPDLGVAALLRVLCDAAEFAELPVRHNEDQVNATLAASCPLPVDELALDAAHVKASLLLQCHIGRLPLPMSDYVTDTKGVLDQAVRVLQAMVDIAADAGSLPNTLGAMGLCQSLCQAAWQTTPQLLALPHFTPDLARRVGALDGGRCGYLAHLAERSDAELARALAPLAEPQRREVVRVLRSFPLVSVEPRLPAPADGSGGPAALTLEADAEGELTVMLRRTNRASERRIHAPLFPKPKGEGWWLALADGAELLALKRVSVGSESRAVVLQLVAPAERGEYEYTLLLISDCYVGFDQQIAVRVIVE